MLYSLEFIEQIRFHLQRSKRVQEGLIQTFSLDKQTAYVIIKHFVYFPRIMLICQEQTHVLTHVQWTKMYDYSAAERDSHCPIF